MICEWFCNNCGRRGAAVALRDDQRKRVNNSHQAQQAGRIDRRCNADPDWYEREVDINAVRRLIARAAELTRERAAADAARAEVTRLKRLQRWELRGV